MSWSEAFPFVSFEFQTCTPTRGCCSCSNIVTDGPTWNLWLMIVALVAGFYCGSFFPFAAGGLVSVDTGATVYGLSATILP